MLRHAILVTVFSDANRPVDVEHVFPQPNAAEHEFISLSCDVVDGRDGWAPADHVGQLRDLRPVPKRRHRRGANLRSG